MLIVTDNSTAANADSVGFVPTMGALHEGHLALVRAAQTTGLPVTVSIFVNPLQFGAGEDFERYPRTLEQDKALLDKAGVDNLFLPAVADLYPDGFATSVHVKSLGDVLCGTHRPGHFDGVATVVAKLLNIVKPVHTFFGEKDWQQLAIVRRMATDLNLTGQIHGVPTVRDHDGLALSSRNRYLSVEQRQQGAALPAALRRCAEAIAAEPHQWEQHCAAAKEALAQNGFQRIDYLECRHGGSLALPPQKPFSAADYRVFVAAHIGKTRLIDNMPVPAAV